MPIIFALSPGADRTFSPLTVTTTSLAASVADTGNADAAAADAIKGDPDVTIVQPMADMDMSPTNLSSRPWVKAVVKILISDLTFE